jgi:hypothetical protein
MHAVRKTLLRPGVLYFAQFCVFASPGRFISVFLRNFGLSDSKIGIVLSIPTALSLLTIVYGGVYADSVANGKTWAVLVSNIAASGAFQFFLGAFFFESGSHARLVYIAFIYALFKTARNPIGPVLDAYTLEYLSKEGAVGDEEASKARRGRERMWGAVGWGITSILLGLCLDIFGFSAVYVFNAVATVGMIVIVVYGMGIDNLFSSLALDYAVGFEPVAQSNDATNLSEDASQGVSNIECEEFARSQSDALDFFHVLVGDFRSAVFLFTVACLGAGVSLVESLVFLFFVEDIGASNFLCGFSVVVTVLWEIPLFWLGDRIMRSMSGSTMMLVAMLCYFTRVVVYTLISKKRNWLVLLVEPLHGMTYSLSNLATVSQMSEMAPPHLQVRFVPVFFSFLSNFVS